MSLRLQSSSNTPNILLKMKPQIDRFLFNKSVDPDGYFMLSKIGFMSKPSDVNGFVWMFLPDLNKFTKEEQDEYLRKHPAVLNKPTKWKGQNLNGLPPKS